MSTQLESSEAAILNRVIQPDSGDWSRAAAEAILAMGFNDTDREQMTALLEKAQAGDLTNEESEALEHYRHIGKLLELMNRALGVRCKLLLREMARLSRTLELEVWRQSVRVWVFGAESFGSGSRV
jgi:hypothetical protein